MAGELRAPGRLASSGHLETTRHERALLRCSVGEDAAAGRETVSALLSRVSLSSQGFTLLGLKGGGDPSTIVSPRTWTHALPDPPHQPPKNPLNHLERLSMQNFLAEPLNFSEAKCPSCRFLKFWEGSLVFLHSIFSW